MANNRRTRVVFRGGELLHNWSTPSDTVRSATVNGQEPPRDRLRATGLDPDRFALLRDKYQPMEVLHLEDLNIAWYPDLRWQIGERIRKE